MEFHNSIELQTGQEKRQIKEDIHRWENILAQTASAVKRM